MSKADGLTHLYRVIVNGVDTINTEPNANKHDDCASTPTREFAGPRGAGWWVRGCVYIGLEDLTIDGNRDTERCFWEAMDEGSGREINIGSNN
jgi:hypothetical protein